MKKITLTLMLLFGLSLMVNEANAQFVTETAGTTTTVNPSNGDVFTDPTDGTNGGPGGDCSTTSSGDLGDYPNCNCVTVTTLEAPPGGQVSITFTSFRVFGNFDWMAIFDGAAAVSATNGSGNASNPTSSDPVLWNSSVDGDELVDMSNAGMVTFTSTNGSLTIASRFSGVVNTCGWEADITVTGGGPSPIASCGNAPELIPASGTTGLMNPSLANVADAGVVGTNYSIESVDLNLQHTWADDLEIVLVSPAGTRLALCTDNGGSSGLDTTADLIFTDASTNDITGWGSGSPAADYRAEGGGNVFPVGFGDGPGADMNVVFDGESITGDWTLEINDDVGGDSGQLNSFCINFAPILGDPPIIVCPADITASTDPGACGAVVNFGTPAAIDPDGDLDEVVQTQGPPSGSEFPVGTTLVEFTAYDLAGNSASCTFNVTVTDDELPEVTCNDIVAELDENGMITLLPEDVAGATDNCPGTILEFLSSGGPTGSLQTIEPFFSDNGGSPGGAVYFDITVGPTPIDINALDLNISGAGNFTVDVYTTPTTHVGNETNMGVWTMQAIGNGASNGEDNISSASLDVPVSLAASTSYGIALVLDGGHSHEYTNGNGSNQSFSNADLTIDLGSASNAPFTGTIFSPRVWNGIVHYGSAGTPVASLDFTCADVGENTVIVQATDAAGNTSTCSATVTVEDNIAPVIQCWGQPGGADYLEEFEAASIPAGWSTIITSGAQDWEFGSGAMPGGPDFPTNAAIFDDDAAGPSADNTAELLSPVFDIASATTATLSFDWSLQDFVGEGNFTVDVWDGAAWQTILFETEDQEPINTGALDMTPYLNADFQVRFTYDDDDGWGWGAGVDNFHLVYDVPSTPLVVELDASGVAIVDASSLLVSVDEACGYTVTTGGGAPVPGTLSTLFASNNGGSNGGAVYFDVTIGPEDISITDIDINTDESGAFTMDVYTAPDTYVGNEGNAGAWTLETSSSGTAAGAIDTPTNAELDTPLTLEAGMSYGIALVLDADHGHSYTNGDGSNENYSNADLSLAAGAASNVPFDGAPFSPRVFNGNINYIVGAAPSETIEFTCEDLGSNTIDITATDDSGNTASCTATVIVVDVTDPVLVCMDAVVEIGEDGTAEVLPEYFIDTANSFDNCGITITAVDVTDVTCDDVGSVITVTVFASDADGNLASCTAEMTVVDAMGPIIENCPEDMTVDPGPLNLFYELPDYWATTDATATDNCTDPVTILGQDPAAGTLLPDGVYTITLFAEDEYGNVGECTFELTIESILGVDDYSLENGVVLYPNPANHTVNIANATSIQLESAAIYDINGRLVQNIDLSNMTTEQSVDVSNLASGVYMVQIFGAEGQTVKRLVKE